MQIKVEDTRMHNITLFETSAGSRTKDVPVAEAKLVLVESIKEKALLGYTEYSGYSLKEKWLCDAEWINPILISETEKIEVGDWYYIKEDSVILQADYEPVGENIYKILALPEHFSPQRLQDIIDGKLKEGKCLVECEKNVKYNKVWWCEEHKPVRYKNISNVIPTSIYQEGDSNGLHYKVHIALPTGEMKVDLDEIEVEENNQLVIKLNPHITIYPVEEKTYTREEVYDFILNALAQYRIILETGDVWRNWDTNKWFKQNVK